MIDTEDCADSYVADGTANPRSIGFRILDPSYLFVLADGVPQDLNSDYTISGDYDGGQGRFTPNPIMPWPAGTVIFYKRVTQPLQKAKILPGVPLPSAAVERELDRRAMIEQDLGREIDRAPKVPDGEPAMAPFPTIAGRSSRLPIWDEQGNFSALAALAGTGTGIVSIAPNGTPSAIDLSLLIPRPNPNSFHGGPWDGSGGGQPYHGGAWA